MQNFNQSLATLNSDKQCAGQMRLHTIIRWNVHRIRPLLAQVCRPDPLGPPSSGASNLATSESRPQHASAAQYQSQDKWPRLCAAVFWSDAPLAWPRIRPNMYRGSLWLFIEIYVLFVVGGWRAQPPPGCVPAIPCPPPSAYHALWAIPLGVPGCVCRRGPSRFRQLSARAPAGKYIKSLGH